VEIQAEWSLWQKEPEVDIVEKIKKAREKNNEVVRVVKKMKMAEVTSIKR